MAALIPNDTAPRSYQIKAYVTGEELEYLKKACGGMSLSTYARNTLLKAGNGRYEFTIEDGDLSQVADAITEFNQRLSGTIGALSYRSELCPSDIQNLEKQTEEVKDILKACLKEIRNDRKAIRKQGEQHLKAKMDEIIKSEDFQQDINKTGRRGRRKARSMARTTIIVGSPSGNTRKAMSIVKDAVDWGDDIVVASDDPTVQAWIDVIKSSGEWQTLFQFQQNCKKHEANTETNTVANQSVSQKSKPSPVSSFVLEDDDDYWDDDWNDWEL